MKGKTVPLIAALWLVRCATVVTGPAQRVAIESDPPGASIRLIECGRYSSPRAGQTPKKVWVSRIATRCTIELSKAGYEKASVQLYRWRLASPNQPPTVRINCADIDCRTSIDRVIGVLTSELINSAAGAQYVQVPRSVMVELRPVSPHDKE